MNTVLVRHAAAPRQPLLARVTAALALWRSRQALARLDDAALRDVGLTRFDAQAEARRPLWDTAR